MFLPSAGCRAGRREPAGPCRSRPPRFAGFSLITCHLVGGTGDCAGRPLGGCGLDSDDYRKKKQGEVASCRGRVKITGTRFASAKNAGAFAAAAAAAAGAGGGGQHGGGGQRGGERA